MAPKKTALAALAVLSLSTLAAADNSIMVEDAVAPPAAPAAAAAGESKADKIAKLTPKDPWTPSSVKLPAGTLADQFASVADFEKHWTASRTQKEDVPAPAPGKEEEAKVDPDLWRYRGRWAVEEPKVLRGSRPGDLGLVMQSPAAHHAISRKLPAPVAFKGKETVTIQYEVKLQNGLECGGAYLKLLSQDAKFEPASFSDKSPYTIMFGPDKCGGTNKVHFIFRHKNAKTGETKEHHLKNPPSVPSTYSKETHLYTLLVHPESNTYEIKIDGESKQKGSLFDDFEPSVLAPKEIDDPTDSKPADWVDIAMIPDPEATKPEDWDEDAPLEIPDAKATKPADWLDNEPEYVPDPEAAKPEDWDDEEDGEWTAPTVANPKCAAVSGCGEWTRPTIRNPDYKGKWTAPLIDNPAYKGVWAPRKIANPEFVDEKHPGHMTPIGAVGLELWTMQDQILFDNILVSDSVTPAQLDAWTKDTWVPKNAAEKEIAKVEEPDTKLDDAADLTKDAAASKAPIAWKDQLKPENLQVFATQVLVDPIAAAKRFPVVAGGLGAAIALFVTLLVTSIFGSASSSAENEIEELEGEEEEDEDETEEATEEVKASKKSSKPSQSAAAATASKASQQGSKPSQKGSKPSQAKSSKASSSSTATSSPTKSESGADEPLRQRKSTSGTAKGSDVEDAEAEHDE
ncbi:hypothetical protein H9P43_003379 [Blastocladiella emersonii ATCC 22665]|nr:hypothetical protein H9P43_003379 [Blastocladiella emersonii ATCC 22665]